MNGLRMDLGSFGGNGATAASKMRSRRHHKMRHSVEVFISVDSSHLLE
jgi:hypothetical protein